MSKAATRRGLTVGIVGAGLIGHKRAAALAPTDSLFGVTDLEMASAEALAGRYGGRVCLDVGELLALRPEVVVVATSHDALRAHAERALIGGAHVLVEKPAGLGSEDVRQLIRTSERAGRLVKVGFNHRFYPGIARAVNEVRSGRYGDLMHVRGRYGHGGRSGYEQEWRAQPERSGGGELVDQGMHMLDLVHCLAGPLPLHSALLRTHFWETPVEDNAALLLGVPEERAAPWAMIHVTWTEWKNLFSLEIYCRHAKLHIDGLVRSYGAQRLRIYKMGPEMGPPELEEHVFPDEDVSWSAEWEQFAQAIVSDDAPAGDLKDALYAWSRIEEAYASTSVYAGIRELARQ